MNSGKTFLVNVGMQDLPFPMKVPSKTASGGQSTVAGISVHARIMKEFEAEWINRFIQVTHRHRGAIGLGDFKASMKDYAEALEATSVRIEISFPYFVEKKTPVSGETCLVKYDCTYSGRYPSLDNDARILFGIRCPIVTSYPLPGGSSGPAGNFPQLSVLHIEVQPKGQVYAEDLAALADSQSLAPVYSYLSHDDQLRLIEEAQRTYRSSVDAVDAIRLELSKDRNIGWYSLSVSNYGLFQNYSTVLGLEKSRWVPGTYYEDEEP